jgi:hypothetical protein
MKSEAELVRLAQLHVKRGEVLVDEQAERVRRMRARGFDATAPEDLLRSMQAMLLEWRLDLERRESDAKG